jgi:hypothetical protein
MIARLTRRADGDDGFAMILALLLIVIMASTSVVLAGVLEAQQRPTLLAKKYIRTINGAQAGLQNTLSALQAATTVAGTGDPTKLPCSDPGDKTAYGGGGVSVYVTSAAGVTTTITVPGDPVSGTVATDGNGNDAIGYDVGVVYYNSNPQLHQNDASWLSSSSNVISCKGGYVSSIPTYALVQSSGTGVQITGATATSGNRTLQGVYQFNAVSKIIVGGRLGQYNSTQQFTLCLDVGTAAIGSTPTMQACQALGYAQQLWVYRNDLTLFYGGNPALNLCIENVSGTPKLETCTGDGTGTGTDTTYPYHSTEQQNQEWAFNDNGHIANADSTGNAGSNCLQAAGSSDTTPAVSGAALTYTACTGGTSGYNAWNPDPQTGAGSALVYYNPSAVPAQTPPAGVPSSSPTNQFVNFAEFGRCLDVTGQDVGADHLIDYPCKQAPNYCNLTWNQVWAFQAVSGVYGQFYTDYASGRSACGAQGTNYCLTEPGSGTYITVTPCITPAPLNQLWNATGAQATYAASYLLKSDLDGKCMAADPDNQATFGSSTIVAAPCTDTGTGAVPTNSSSVKNPLLLKWNAAPNNPASGLQNVKDSGPGAVQAGS